MTGTTAEGPQAVAFEPHGGSVRTLHQYVRSVVAPLDVHVGCYAMALAHELATAAVEARSRFEVAATVESDVLRLELTSEAPVAHHVIDLLDLTADRSGSLAEGGGSCVWFEFDVDGSSCDDSSPIAWSVA